MGLVVSMTGYGRGEARGARIALIAEARSLNHRFFETSVKLPRGLTANEPELRRLVQGRIARGRVDMTVTLRRTAAAAPSVRTDVALGLAYARGARALGEAAGVAVRGLGRRPPAPPRRRDGRGDRGGGRRGRDPPQDRRRRGARRALPDAPDRRGGAGARPRVSRGRARRLDARGRRAAAGGARPDPGPAPGSRPGHPRRDAGGSRPARPGGGDLGGAERRRGGARPARLAPRAVPGASRRRAAPWAGSWTS